MNRTTPEARLIESGWNAPTAPLRAAIWRREALRSAIAALKAQGATGTIPVVEAIADADRAGIINAITTHALGAWLDGNCQNPSSELTAWSATAEQALAAAIYADAPQVAASLEPFADAPDARYVRALAERATSYNVHLVGANGQPAAPRPDALSMFTVMVSR